MFNKQELEFIYLAINQMPPPNSTVGGKNKAHMIAKCCDLMDQLDREAQEAAQAEQAGPDSELAKDVADIQKRQQAKAGKK